MANTANLISTAQATKVLGVSRATFDRYSAKAQAEPDFKGAGLTAAQWWSRKTINHIAKINEITAAWTEVDDS